MFKPGDRVVVVYDKYITNDIWKEVYPEGCVVTLTELNEESDWKTDRWSEISRCVISERNMVLEEIYNSPLFQLLKEEE